MPSSAKKRISLRLMGNSHRKDIPHDEATKRKISQSVIASYREGRRQAHPQPLNIAAYNAALKSGSIQHPRKNPARDAAIAEHYATSKSMRETGVAFGITASSVSEALRRPC
jgi:hypothetical protein